MVSRHDADVKPYIGDDEETLRLWLGPDGPDVDQSERYDRELLTIREAARCVRLSPSYLRLSAAHRLPSGRRRLRTHVVGRVSFVTRRDLHVFVMSRNEEGSGSVWAEHLPGDYWFPPYEGERLDALTAEIAEVRAELAQVSFREWRRRRVHETEDQH